MKIRLTSLLGALCLAVGILGTNTSATAAVLPSIYGSLDFSGDAATDTGVLATATKFTSFSNVKTGNHTGVYTPIPTNTPVTMQGFTFKPTGSGVSPLWTIVIGAVTYSFDLTAVTMSSVTNPIPGFTFLAIVGNGVAHVTGYADTPGVYSLTTQQFGSTTTATFSFSATTSVPDSGTTVALLGLSLVAVETTRRLINARTAKV